MPAMHGELSTPYYDLPAGNLMPHIIPNSVAPINPHLVKPLQFVAGPADERLATAVKDLLRNVGDIFGDRDRLNEGTVRDVDELGLPTLRRDASGELIGADGYYGWSKAFCEKTKDRRKEKKFRGRGRRGRSESRSESLTPRKRRRYSNSDNSRSRSRDRLRSYSRSRSLSNERSRTLYGGSSKNGLPSKARGCSPRSRSPPGRYQRSGSRSRSRSRSLSYSPPPNPQLLHPNNPGVPQPETAQPNQAPPLPLPPPLPYPVQYPQGVSELIPPIPPPHHPLQPFHNQHPMGHSGSWPPPPSPNTNFYQQGVQYPPQQGYPPPPPPWGAQHAFERGGYSGYVYQGSAPSQQQLQHQNSGQGPDDYGRAKEREIGARRGWKT
ncbi:MAG: hypothetical protein M1840_009114 [Geoglossum simile]|nr:MAG: hypothetical protein M1840_009114 [Geoglossum simile]